MIRITDEDFETLEQDEQVTDAVEDMLNDGFGGGVNQRDINSVFQNSIDVEQQHLWRLGVDPVGAKYTYAALTGVSLDIDGETQAPICVTIERHSDGWYLTNVEMSTAPEDMALSKKRPRDNGMAPDGRLTLTRDQANQAIRYLLEQFTVADK